MFATAPSPFTEPENFFSDARPSAAGIANSGMNSDT